MRQRVRSFLVLSLVWTAGCATSSVDGKEPVRGCGAGKCDAPEDGGIADGASDGGADGAVRTDTIILLSDNDLAAPVVVREGSYVRYEPALSDTGSWVFTSDSVALEHPWFDRNPRDPGAGILIWSTRLRLPGLPSLVGDHTVRAEELDPDAGRVLQSFELALTVVPNHDQVFVDLASPAATYDITEGQELVMEGMERGGGYTWRVVTDDGLGEANRVFVGTGAIDAGAIGRLLWVTDGKVGEHHVVVSLARAWEPKTPAATASFTVNVLAAN